MRWTAILFLGAALAGCATSSPRTYFYTVGSAPAAARAEKSEADALRVSLWQVSIPDLVDRPQLVLRSGGNQVEIADFHRWAEPLRFGIARALAEGLATQSEGRWVAVAGQPAGFTPQVRVSVDVQKFEAILGERVIVDMLWSVRPVSGDARVGRSTVEEPVSSRDHAGIAAAYSRALARVAQDIAPALRPMVRGGG